MTKDSLILRTSARTNIGALKTAIVKSLFENRMVYIDAIGVEANYNTIKAIIKARGEILAFGKELNIRPTMMNIKINGEEEERTAIRWVLQL